jgi:hypothetical protein
VKLWDIYIAMGRPLGAKNKRTLLREANMKEAATRARTTLVSPNEFVRLDSLAIMEEAMWFFHSLVAQEQKRGGDADIEVMRKDFPTAVGIAKEVAPYRHARFSYVKVGSDRANIPDVPEGVTARELRAELFSEIARLGVLPTKSLSFRSVPSRRGPCRVQGGPDGENKYTKKFGDRHFAAARRTLQRIGAATTIPGVLAQARLLPMLLDDECGGTLEESTETFIRSFAVGVRSCLEQIEETGLHADTKKEPSKQPGA